MATNKIQTGIRFEPELLYKITYVAKDNKRSLNAQLEYLAQLCVKEYEAENGEIPWTRTPSTENKTAGNTCCFLFNHQILCLSKSLYSVLQLSALL